MSTNDAIKNAEAMIADYRVWDLEQNPNGPVMRDGEFNEPSQIWGENRRVMRDVKLAEIVKVLGSEKFPSVVVSQEKGVKGIILTYQTPAEDIGCDKVHWVSIPAKATTGGQRKYLTYSKGIILWRVRVLEGNLKLFLLSRLKSSIVSGKYRDDKDAFCKEAASLVRNYPHKDFDLYKKYIGAICQVVSAQEKSATFVLSLAKQISENLKSVLYRDDREGKDSNEIWQLVKEKECIPSVGDCSKNANRSLSKFDMAAIKTDEMFEDLEKKAKEEAEASEKRFNAAFEDEDDTAGDRGIKREREETEDDETDEKPQKVARTDE